MDHRKFSSILIFCALPFLAALTVGSRFAPADAATAEVLAGRAKPFEAPAANSAASSARRAAAAVKRSRPLLITEDTSEVREASRGAAGNGGTGVGAGSDGKPGAPGKSEKDGKGRTGSTSEVSVSATRETEVFKKFYAASLTPEKRAEFQKIISDYRKDRHRAGTAYSLFVIGLIRELSGEFEQAIEIHEKLIRLYPLAKYANLSKERISECYLALDQKDKAIANYLDYFKWRISEAKREEVLFRIARIYNQTLTTLENLVDAYKQAARRYEYSHDKTIEYMVGYFKGFHLLDAHMATFYYRQVLREYPDGLRKFDALLNMSIVFAYDLSDIESAKAMLRRLAAERSEYATGYEKTQRVGALIYGLLSQFHSPKAAAKDAMDSYKSIILDTCEDDIANVAAYYLGYHYEHAYAVEVRATPGAPIFNPKTKAADYLAEIRNDGRRNHIDNALSAYMLGYLIRKDEFYAEECAFRAAFLLINSYSDTASAELIYKSVKKNIRELRRERDFEDLVNLKLPSVFDKSLAALYSKEKKLYENSQYKEAIKAHEEIAARSGKGPEAEYSLYTIARIYEEDLKDFEAAVAAYERFLAAFPRSSRADKVTYQIARICENNLLDLNEAVRYYNKLIDEGHDQLWIFQAGVDLAALMARPVFKKESETVKILERLRERVPMREDEVIFRLAAAYEKSSKKPEKASELYERIVKAYPGSMHFEEALDKLLADQYKDSLEELKKRAMFAQTKNSAELPAILREKFEKEKFVGNYKDALATLEEMKKAAATDEVVLLEKQAAEIQIDGLNEIEKGLDTLKKLAARAKGTPAEHEIYFAIGRVLEEKEKDFKNAVEYYERSISFDAERSKSQMMAMFRAGIVYAINLKDYENAFRCYNMIMMKYPSEARDEKLDAKISNLLNIDPAMLQNFLGSMKIEMKRKKAGEEETAEAELTSDRSAGATAEVSAGGTGEASVLKSVIDSSLGFMEGFMPSASLADDDALLGDEAPTWFKKGGRPSYAETSWFQKRSATGGQDYSWFQKPVDLSDIGISTPSWFMKGGIKVEKRTAGIDEETEKLRAEMELPPVKTSRSVKYLNYIENNPNSPKLPIIYLYLAMSYEEARDFDSAAATYNKIIAEYQDYPKIAYSAYEKLASLVARERREYQKASYLAVKMGEKLPKYQEKAAPLKERIGNYRKIADNDAYIRENIGDEKSLELMYENAKLYEEKLKDYDQAITYLNKCTSYISGETEEVKYKLDIARIAAEKSQNPKLAYEELTDVISRFPSCPEINEVRYRAAELAIEKLAMREAGIALLEKVRDSRKGDKTYRDAMLLLEKSYKSEQIDERTVTVQTLREVVPELRLSPDIERSFKKLDVEKKVKDLLEIIETDPESPANSHYMYYVARLYEREAGDYENAAKYYRILADMEVSEETLIKAITSLGLIYETKLRKPEKAIELYREFIVKNQPDDTDFLAYLQFKIGEGYELMKKRDESIAAYRKVKFYFPISRWVKTAEDRVAQIMASPDRFVTIHERGFDEFDEFETTEVKAPPKGTFEVALETGEISLTSAEIEIAAEKDPEKKIEKLTALIDSRPEKDPKLPNYLIELARVYEQTQKADKAAEALKRIVEEFPKYERYYDITLKLAEMYRVARNVEEAVRYYKKIVDESPQYDKTEYVRYTLGTLYIEKKEYMYAIDTFRELTDRYQDSVYAKKAQYEKGLVNERFMKDYDAAIQDFEVMAERYFDHENAPDAQFEIGWIYENAKRDYQRARDAYQKVIDKFPNTPRRREVIEAIERINTKLPK